MIKLEESLPETVTVDGRDYFITTDYRDWIRFEKMISSDELDDSEKIRIMLEFFEPDEDGCVDLPVNIAEALNALVWFYGCGDAEQSRERRKKGEKIYDFDEDISLIHAGFKQSYDIDLFYAEHFHWWAFRSLLEAIPDNTRFSQIVSIRAADLSEMSKSERKRYAKLKEACALKGKEPKRKAMTQAEREQEMIERVRKINHRANAPNEQRKGLRVNGL